MLIKFQFQCLMDLKKYENYNCYKGLKFIQRSELTKTAEKASVEVFASNLKKLLLMPPVRGRVVLGVDPGFRNGCKWAITSETGKLKKCS